MKLPLAGGILFFNGRLTFHILDVENEPRKTSVPPHMEQYKKDFSPIYPGAN